MRNRFFIHRLLFGTFVIAALGCGNTSAAPGDEPTTLHQGQGTVKDVDLQRGSVKIQHDAIGSLNWPAMTMDFKVDHPRQLDRLQAGQQVDFQLRSIGPQRYVITKITPTNRPKTDAR